MRAQIRPSFDIPAVRDIRHHLQAVKRSVRGQGKAVKGSAKAVARGHHRHRRAERGGVASREREEAGYRQHDLQTGGWFRWRLPLIRHFLTWRQGSRRRSRRSRRSHRSYCSRRSRRSCSQYQQSEQWQPKLQPQQQPHAPSSHQPHQPPRASPAPRYRIPAGAPRRKAVKCTEDHDKRRR